MGKAFLVRPLSFTVSEVSGTAAGTAAADLADDNIGLVWRASGTVGVYAIIDLGATAPSIDFYSFLSMLPASAVTIRARAYDSLANAQAAGATGLSYDSTALAANAGANVPFTGRQNSWGEIAGGHSARFWRFDFGGLTAAFEAARLVVGERLQFSRNFSFGRNKGIGDTGSVDWTPTGAMLRRLGAIFRTIDLRFESLSSAEVEDELEPILEIVGNTRPVLVVTDPDAHANRARRMWFGPITSPLSTSIRAYDLNVWPATVRSLI